MRESIKLATLVRSRGCLTRSLRTYNLKNKRHNRQILSEQDVGDIVEGISDGFGTQEIAKHYKVKRHAISNIKMGHTWSYLTGITPRSHYASPFGRESD